MVILKTESAVGHAPPPQSPYSIVTNLPGWDTLHEVREGNMAPLAAVVHIYPRFSPTHFAAILGQQVARKVGLEGLGCHLYLDPIMWKFTSAHVAHEGRRENILTPDNLHFKVVDIAEHRLYAILYELKHSASVQLSWGTPGIGVSIREAENLLKSVDSMVEVPCHVQNPPSPTWTPEGPAHEGVRQRVVEMLHHGAIETGKPQCQTKDVFLFPTGMAAVFHTKNILQAYRPGTNVALGVVFHNTHSLIDEDSPYGCRLNGNVDREALDNMEASLHEEIAASKKTSFVLVEFPGNPTLATVNLKRLKQLSEKFGFVLIVDDTIASFGNVDVLAYSDILLTSLTKSFSGRSDVMGGSIVLNPSSPHYSALSVRFANNYHNELFAADAETLLANSQDYYSRTVRLNSNAKAMAEFLHKSIGQGHSPITKVHYPSLLPSQSDYDTFKRRSTAEIPEPGYGCLLTVDFESVATAKAFYDRCGFYPSPHLGGHVTIMLPYNMFMYGKDPKESAEMRELGMVEESIRISAGLENHHDLLDTLQDALDTAIKEKTK